MPWRPRGVITRTHAQSVMRPGLLVMWGYNKKLSADGWQRSANSSSQLLSAFLARAAACGSATTLPPRTVAPMTIAALMMTTFLMMY